MPDIFGAGIAVAIADGLGDLVFDQTLVKVVSSRDPNNSTRQVSVSTPHPCKGFIDDYSRENLRGTNVRITDHKVVILGATLPSGVVPEPGDQILAEGRTFTIQQDGVARDPAGAAYECRSR